MKIRRYAVLLAAAAFMLLLFWHVRPAGTSGGASPAALVPYADYLALYDVAPEDILSYAVTCSKHKTTLQLTLRSPSQSRRVLSIAVDAP